MQRPQSRRQFLVGVSGGAVLLPTALEASRFQTRPEPGGEHGESYWEEIRRQFSFRDERVPMNAANLCPSPRVVAEEVSALTHDIDRDCSSQNRRKFVTLQEASRAKVAATLGVSPDEIALVRNTSEANNIINNGIPLEAGDEVVVWDQNHPTNNIAWEVRAARFGFAVRRVATPMHPSGVDELAATFERVLTPQTRVLALTQVSNVSGIKLPVAELCEVAHRRGIHVHVDGAQSWGALDLDLRALGCDSFSASAHKWFLGPKEVGLLYVKLEHVGRLWPGVVAPSWGREIEPSPIGARKFESMGQRDDAALAAIGTTDDFHARIGGGRIETRIVSLATRLKEGLHDVGYTLLTPMAPEISAGVCIAGVAGSDRGAVVQGLYEEHGIAGAGTGGLRLCPHLYNTVEHVERAVRGASALHRVA